MKKEMINFDFRYVNTNSTDEATSYVRGKDERTNLSKENIINKISGLKEKLSLVSSEIKNNNGDSTILFKFKDNKNDFLVRIVINEKDPYYKQILRLSDFYKLKKKYNSIKVLAVTAGIVLAATSLKVPAKNFVKATVEKDNENINAKDELNKLRSLVLRLSNSVITRGDYSELKNLMIKYGNELEPEELDNYNRIIDENKGRVIN